MTSSVELLIQVIAVACGAHQRSKTTTFHGQAPDNKFSSSTEMATGTPSTSHEVVAINTVDAGTTVFEFPSTTIVISPQTGANSEETTQTLLSGLIPVQSEVSGTAPVETFPVLTTTFIPPTSCLNRYYVTEGFNPSVLLSGTLDPLFESCQATSGQMTYMPGMCPGLMKAELRAFDGSEFTEICCQSGFSWDPRGCASLMLGSTSVPVYLTTTSSGFDSSSVVSSVVAVHAPVTVIWVSTDLSLFPADVAASRSAILSRFANILESNSTASTSESNSTLSTSESNRTVSTAVNNDTTESYTGTALSLPARIGIGVGVAMAVIITIITISAYLHKMRRGRRRLPIPARNNAKELDGGQPIWKRFFGREWRAELPQDGRTAELAAEQQPSELTATQSPVELPGSYDFPAPAAESTENKERYVEPAS